MDDATALFISIRGNLLSFAISIVRNEEDAQDIVQEAFRECIEIERKEFNRSYLFQAVRNRSLNKIRSKTRYLRAIERFTDYLKDSFAESFSDEFSIMDLVNKLPEKQREVLVLRIKAELKISEISQVLDIPEGTVKSRLNKALGYLKKHLKGKSNE